MLSWLSKKLKEQSEKDKQIARQSQERDQQQFYVSLLKSKE